MINEGSYHTFVEVCCEESSRLRRFGTRSLFKIFRGDSNRSGSVFSDRWMEGVTGLRCSVPTH